MKYRLLVYTLLAAVVAVSCKKEDKAVSALKHISFSAGIDDGLNYDVKATSGSSFAEGKYNLGLWICDGNADPSYNSPLLEEFRNTKCEYTVERDSVQWSFFGNGISWQNTIAVNDGYAVDIYSYYPWNERITDITAIPFINDGTDYLWCRPVELSSAVTTGDEVLDVSLEYRHVMACIEIAVKANVNDAIMMDKLTLTDKSGNNIPVAGTFNAATGEVSLEGMTDSLSHTIGVMLANDETTPRIQFLIPKYENYAGNFELSFKFNGIDGATKYVIPSDITQSGSLEQGKKYIIELQLNEAMKFSTAEFKTVDDWNDEIYKTDIEL